NTGSYMLAAGTDMAKIKKLKRQLSQELEMKDLGFAKQILGMSIIRDKMNSKAIPREIHKEGFRETEASRQRMAKVPYASIVGSVMYAMVCTRTDIAHAVGVVNRFMSNPGREHWEVVKKEVVLEGFFDSDYEGCLDSGKSTTGYVFTVGGTTLSWMSKIQKCVAMSTTGAEYIAITEAGKELSAIHLAKNLILGAKNPVDMLTKVVTREKLCATSTGLRDN
ncbi:hypothetical protein Tco_0020734, partial [Tanacetum coccineum]